MRRILCFVFVAGCSGADFNVGAVGLGSDAGDDAEEVDTGTGETPDAGPTDSRADSGTPDTGKPPSDTGIDTGTPDTGTPDTGTPPVDSGTDTKPTCPDLDGDGEADKACGGTDCHDGNPDVYSKQTAWFATPYTLPGGGTSWDYNCNAKGDLEYPESFKCTKPDGAAGGCKVTAIGWAGLPQACGLTGARADACSTHSATSSCWAGPEIMTLQRCH